MKRPELRVVRAANLLILIRHGQAASKDVGLSDFERILTEKGKVECESVAAELARKCIHVDSMISSPADRALETAHLFARQLQFPFLKIQIADALYSSKTIKPLVAEIKKLDSAIRTVAYVGHNPTFDEIAAYYVPGLSRTAPKGSAVGISFDCGKWAGALRGTGRLLFYLDPLGCRTKGSRVRPRQS